MRGGEGGYCGERPGPNVGPGVDVSGWSRGYAEWVEDDAAYLSVVFTWMLRHAYQRACFHRAEGRTVKVGGPAVFHPKMKKQLEGVAEVGGDYPDAIAKQNPDATIASRGCPVNCWFCIVPAMEGTEFTLLPEFPVRPVLADSNLSGLPVDYQEYIIERYVAEGVVLRDACQGFEPRSFDEDTYRRWKPVLRGPWRFAYDDMAERDHVRRMMEILKDEHPNKKRVYNLIGNEDFDTCMERIRETIEWGGVPHVQPFIKLGALDKIPLARHAWTVRKLRDVARWANRFLWRNVAFEDYDRREERRAIPYNRQTGLFEAAT